MKWLLSTFVLVLTAVSSAEPAMVVGHLTSVLPNGVYEGRTEKGKRCVVNVLSGIEKDRGFYSLSIRQEGFDFTKEKGSTQCMGTKACFVYQSNYKVLQMERDGEAFNISVERPAGGIDFARSKEMYASIDASGNAVRVYVVEELGWFSKTTADCTIQ